MRNRFVMLASMRTGSNLLNSYLNQYPGVVCHGEAFNPSFVGLDDHQLARLGWSRNDVERRDRDPARFLELILSVEGKAVGLHMFPGHNPAILDVLLQDRNLKKLCLRRSIIHSFVSLQTARKTDVWRTTSLDFAKDIPVEMRRIIFVPQEFELYRRKVDGFWRSVFKVLSESGQKFFPIWYRELDQVATINSAVQFIGLPESRSALKEKFAKQNPEPLRELVENWDEMTDYAARNGLAHQI